MRSALVTGGSRGIGKAIARKLADDGLNCVLVGRDRDRLDEAVADLTRPGITVLGMVCDVTKPDGVSSLVEQVKSRLCSIDVLVNCAGRSGGGVTRDIDEDLWRAVIEINLNAVFYVTKAVLHSGVMGSGGAVINIASTGGKQGVIHGAPYSASKHGVIGFTKALGLELARDGADITVNAVCPGFVETEMAEQVRVNYAKLWNVSPAEAKRHIEARVPIGRYIEPEEVAAMVSYLASPAARGVTAQAMNVCGGLGNY